MSPRQTLRHLFDIAVDAVSAARVVTSHLPVPPPGRTVVIGFGKAGPNILTALGAIVSEYIQPLIEPFMEEEFNLADFVKEHGQRLAKTMLGGTTVFLGGVVSGLTFVVIVHFVAFFFLKDGHRLTRHMIEFVPTAYFELCLNL